MASFRPYCIYPIEWANGDTLFFCGQGRVRDGLLSIATLTLLNKEPTVAAVFPLLGGTHRFTTESACASDGDITYKRIAISVRPLIRPTSCSAPLSPATLHSPAGMHHVAARARLPVCRRLPQPQNDIAVPRPEPNDKMHRRQQD